MASSKFDAALCLHCVNHGGEAVQVSVRLHSTLTDEEVARFQQLGLADADTRRHILFGRLSPDALQSLNDSPKVASLSLVQKSQPKRRT